MAEEFNSRGVSCAGYVYRGASSELLACRTKHTKGSKEPTHIVVQSGDIDIRELTLQEAMMAHDKLTKSVHGTYPNSRVLVTTVPNKVNSALLRHKINKLNDIIMQKCAKNPEMSAIDCSNMSLKDNIHLTDTSKSRLASIAINIMLYF